MNRDEVGGGEALVVFLCMIESCFDVGGDGAFHGLIRRHAHMR